MKSKARKVAVKKVSAPAKKKTKASSKRARAIRLYKPTHVLRPGFYRAVSKTLQSARLKAYRAINSHMVDAYWTVGRQIIEEEQLGKNRADYGTALLYHLSIRLNADFGAGFDERELRRMRQFYRSFPIRGALRPELSSDSLTPHSNGGKLKVCPIAV